MVGLQPPGDARGDPCLQWSASLMKRHPQFGVSSAPVQLSGSDRVGKRGSVGVLVLDGEQRAALAVVRSLARAGFRVHVASHQLRAISFASRFCRGQHLCANPISQPEEYAAAIAAIAIESACALVLPVTEQSIQAMYRLDISERRFVVGVSDELRFRRASSKQEVLMLARDMGVRVPSQWEIHQREVALSEGIVYPVAVKAARSVVGDRRLETRYAAAPSALRQVIASYPDAAFPLLVQQRIEGVGVGVFLLRLAGRYAARFAHRRERELPPSGGSAVSAVSIPLSEAPVESAEALLNALDWEGPAMVEFKVTPAGVPYLMEINPRFWGSLQLAVSAGVDFPSLWSRALIGEQLPAPSGYRTDVRERNLSRELEWLWAILSRNAEQLQLPLSMRSRRRLLRGFA